MLWLNLSLHRSLISSLIVCQILLLIAFAVSLVNFCTFEAPSLHCIALAAVPLLVISRRHASHCCNSESVLCLVVMLPLNFVIHEVSCFRCCACIAFCYLLAWLHVFDLFLRLCCLLCCKLGWTETILHAFNLTIVKNSYT